MKADATVERANALNATPSVDPGRTVNLASRLRALAAHMAADIPLVDEDLATLYEAARAIEGLGVVRGNGEIDHA